jgi:hypothetical protein
MDCETTVRRNERLLAHTNHGKLQGQQRNAQKTIPELEQELDEKQKEVNQIAAALRVLRTYASG